MSSLAEQIRQLPCADGSKHFLTSVRKILLDFKALSPEDDVCSILASLVNLYCSCPSRVAAKRAMASFFQGLEGSLRVEFKSQLCHQLKECMKVNNIQEGNITSIRQSVDNVNALMENFKLGEECLFSVFEKVLQFLIQAEKHFLSGFGPDVPPVSLNEVMLNCHVTMQTINLVLQKTAVDCSEKIKEFLDMSQLLSDLMLLDIQIIHNDIFLLDCRCCCAMNAFLLLQLTFSDDNVTNVIPSLLIPKFMNPNKSILPPWLTETQAGFLSLNSCQPLTFLALTFGYIAMVTISSISHISTVYNNFFIDILLPEILLIGKRCENSPSKTLYAKTVNLWTAKLLSAMEQPTSCNLLAKDVRGDSVAISHLLNYVWTHWDDQLDILHQSAKTVFENALKFHVKACSTTDVDSTPFIMSLLTKVLAVSWSSRGKFGALKSCSIHVGASHLLNVRPSLPEEILQQLQEQATSSYASDLYSSLFSSHRREVNYRNSTTGSNLPSLPDINQQHQSISSPLREQHQTATMEVWILPVVKAMNSRHQRWKQNILEYLLPKLMKNDADILDFMIEKMSSMIENQVGINQAYGAIIMCLRRARVMGLLKSKSNTSSDDLWFGILNPNILRLALCGLNEQLRLDAFALFCENCKTSEAITPFEFEMLQLFIPYNVNNQSPAFRQSFVSLLKKLFFRLKESLALLNRVALKKGSSSTESLIKLYNSFLLWLTNFFLDNIYSGSTYARKSTCLTCLTLMTSFFSHSKDGFSVPDHLNQEHLQIFINCLSDNFEDNKKEALNILSIYATINGSIGTPDFLKTLLEISFSLACSTKPQDCESAAYLFILLLKQPSLWNVLKDFQPALKCDKLKSEMHRINEIFVTSDLFTSITTDAKKIFSSLYLLNLLCLYLNDQIKQAESSLVTAAANGPMYPTLHCIRYIMQDLDWNSLPIKFSPFANQFINDLIHTCLKLAGVVSPVVQNSSPEGNVPANAIIGPGLNMSDFLHSLNITEDEEMKARLESRIPALETNDNIAIQAKDGSQAPELAQSVILSQILVEAMPEYLVVCCWRSIKEVSLVLGKLCLQIPVAKIGLNFMNDDSSKPPDSASLLSLDQIEMMGKYFTHQLLESIHRGAFELAYAGFQFMCQMLWSHPAPEFHKLPSHWLQQVITDVKSPQSKLCATRRSAGVPFFVQAIISSEPPATGRKCFHDCMKELLMLALGQDQATEDHEDAQVHALNILRTLYRDARLGDDVAPYISDGLKGAILGFKSDLWAVRNSATLLLSALMTRIFGVKRAKDEIGMSKKNCLTSRSFFHRYPNLYQFLLHELENATANVDRKDVIHLHPSLYPILLVLGRLFPSSLEGSDTSLSLSAFIPYILKCASSPVYKTRIIAARALQPMAKKSQVTEIIGNLFINIPSSASNLNSCSFIHGSLLQLRHLMKLIENLNDTLKEEALTILVSKFIKCSWLLSSQNPCCATQQEALKLVDAVLVVTESLNSQMEELQKNVRILKTYFLSLMHNSPPQSLKWKPFFYDLEKTKASLIIKFLYTFESDEDNHQRHCLKFKRVNFTNNGEEDKFVSSKTKVVLDLLNSPFHEARLEALNGLISALALQRSFVHQKDSEENCLDGAFSSNLDEEENKTKFMEVSDAINHTSPQAIHLVTKLVTGLFDSILTIAMEQEDHHECLEKVFHLLSTIPDCTSQLKQIGHANLKKIFKTLMHRIETERRSQVKASMLRFSSCIVSHLYDWLTSAEEHCEEQYLLQKWINIQTSLSRIDADPVLQHSVAISLQENASLLLCDPHHKLGAMSLMCWDVMVILLQADDLEVKDIASSALGIACGKNQDVFHPSYALFKLPEFLISLQGKLGFNKLFKSLVSWILLQETNEEEESEERLFERGEINTYWDQIAFSRSVIQTLVELLQNLHVDSAPLFHHKNINKAELIDLILATTSRLTQELEVITETMKMADSLTSPGKYAHAYLKMYQAEALLNIFRECQYLGISFDGHFLKLEELVNRIKQNVSLFNL